jgi:hypothetical protein
MRTSMFSRFLASGRTNVEVQSQSKLSCTIFQTWLKERPVVTCNADYVTHVGPETVAKNTVVPSSCLA